VGYRSTVLGAAVADEDAAGTARPQSTASPARPDHADVGFSGAQHQPEPVRDELAAAFAETLARRQDEEIARGMTVIGPHRDDMTFAVNGIDMRTFGSRGQQRTAVLALKLAEARRMWTETGERPVLLLDDVLSELDPERRQYLLSHIDAHQQTLVTTTDTAQLPPEFLRSALVLTVKAGAVVESRAAG
jgi:DNA replication and repair protein RecF